MLVICDTLSLKEDTCILIPIYTKGPTNLRLSVSWLGGLSTEGTQINSLTTCTDKYS